MSQLDVVSKQIYKSLGKTTKTKDGLVVIWPVYRLDSIHFAESIGGISSLRLDGRPDGLDFGNPFSSVKTEIEKGCIKTKSVKESVVNYIKWILDDNTTIFQNKREWILSQLKSKYIKGKPIVYYRELGEPSHATALHYLANNWFS